MIRQEHFTVEPWAITETKLDFDLLAQTESVFALSNGHIGLRANLDEGEPVGIPGTYLAGFFEGRPLPYAEAGYGFPESGQTAVNVTNGKIMRLLIDDEPFDVRYGELHSHRRVLDLRAGTLCRTAEWSSPAGRRIEVTSTRLVSFTQRAVAAICYDVRVLGDDSSRVIVQSELIANENGPKLSNDPRVAAMLESPLIPLSHIHHERAAILSHHTRVSGLRVAAGMDHLVFGPDRMQTEVNSFPDSARVMVSCLLPAGETLRIVKFLAYGWSAERSVEALRDQVAAAIAGAHLSGWDGLLAEQRSFLDEFWDGADVEIEGDPAVQQAVRFGLFHTLQAGARTERRAIAAKGLTGPGYDGHAFWDTEMYVLPVLTATMPTASADALRWRASTLDLAVERAETLHLAGAVFPWRTIRGQECSGYWPAGTAAFHINADIADAVRRYVNWTDDEGFERETGLPLLVNTARMWMSLGYISTDARFHLNGVTGPDEYSAIADDNTYTNVMAAANLAFAAELAQRWRDDATALRVDSEEIAAWRHAAEVMALPFNTELDVYEQSRDFTRHDVWDFKTSNDEDGYPLLLHAPYFDLYRKQVIKQADLMLAMQWHGERFTLEEKAKAFAYYEPLTVRDSSLSACTQAVLAAEVGHLELAHDYLTEAALMDLRDLEHNTRDGVHVASLAGAWLAVVGGFGGVRDGAATRLSFSPALPERITSMSFRLRWHGLRLRVTVDGPASTVAFDLRDHGADGTMPISLYGEDLELAVGQTLTRPLVIRSPLTPRPAQPPGREPLGASP